MRPCDTGQNFYNHYFKYLELHSSNGLIVAVVDILGVGAELPRARGRNGLVVSFGNQVGLAELLALLIGLLAPCTCHDVVSHIGLGAQVQGQHRKLRRCTSLNGGRNNCQIF